MSRASHAKRAARKRRERPREIRATPPIFDPLHWINLGNHALGTGDLPSALGCYRSAIQINPKIALAHHAMGTVYWSQSQFNEAEACFERAVAADPKFWLSVDMLMFRRVYSGLSSAAESFAEHVACARRIEAAAGAPRSSWPNSRDPKRRLRIGYVSGDLRGHSIAAFLEPLMQHHNHDRVEVHVFSNTSSEDAVTERLKTYADHWHMILGKNDAEAAKMVAAAEIDILIDLSGHTTNHRLGLFARKPAPIQMTFMGYPGSTGLSTVDYRIVDGVTDPSFGGPSQFDRLAMETLLRLAGCFLCYRPPVGLPDPGPAPCTKGEPFTFGSFNIAAKLSPAALDAWSKILLRVPGSRLLLKSIGLNSIADRFWIDRAIGGHGVDPHRVVILRPTATAVEHLLCYEKVDVALDPFPYNGTTTTAEALWMGLPVVALAGDRHSSRVGASLLKASLSGMHVAEDVSDYIEEAARLARWSSPQSPEESGLLRQNMRKTMSLSPLCDGPRYAAKFEAALRDCWVRYCEGTPCR